MPKDYVLVKITDGAVEYVASNDREITVIIAEEDRQAEVPASVQAFKGMDIKLAPEPRNLFLCDDPKTSDYETRILDIFGHKVSQEMRDEKYYKALNTLLTHAPENSCLPVYTDNLDKFIYDFNNICSYPKFAIMPMPSSSAWSGYDGDAYWIFKPTIVL